MDENQALQTESELHNRESEVFQLRLQLICASHEFKVAMLRDYGRKSIKPFIMKYWLHNDMIFGEEFDMGDNGKCGYQASYKDTTRCSNSHRCWGSGSKQF